jgi:hypothetical protein
VVRKPLVQLFSISIPWGREQGCHPLRLIVKDASNDSISNQPLQHNAQDLDESSFLSFFTGRCINIKEWSAFCFFNAMAHSNKHLNTHIMLIEIFFCSNRGDKSMSSLLDATEGKEEEEGDESFPFPCCVLVCFECWPGDAISMEAVFMNGRDEHWTSSSPSLIF